jgi:hypothetical protein
MRETLFIRSALKLAIPISCLTVHAKMIAFAEEHGEHEFARFAHFWRVCAHNHVFADRQCAAGLQYPGSFHFDHTQPAAAVWFQTGMVAKPGHFYAQLLCCFKDCRPFWNFYLIAVYRECYHKLELHLLQ